jgi:hypothetical protein
VKGAFAFEPAALLPQRMLERKRRCSSTPFLLVEDNGDRGGASVTFTGLYYPGRNSLAARDRPFIG